MAKDPPPDSAERLHRELRRQGMTEAEIAQALRKKKRARLVEFNALKSRHIMPQSPGQVQSSKARRREAAAAPAQELCTVEFAAERLKLHPKTVLRFIHEGRLKASRIGKSYRILRADLEALAGLPLPAAPVRETPRATSIVEIPGVDQALAQKWMQTVNAALAARAGDGGLSADVIYDPARAHLKIVVVGPVPDAVNLMALIRVWSEQLEA